MLARQEALRQKVNEEEKGLMMMGGTGKLGELFKSAETSSSKSGSNQQQQQQNLGQLFKSAAQSESAAGKTHLSQKNLPNMATVEASPPSQVGRLFWNHHVIIHFARFTWTYSPANQLSQLCFPNREGCSL